MRVALQPLPVCKSIPHTTVQRRHPPLEVSNCTEACPRRFLSLGNELLLQLSHTYVINSTIVWKLPDPELESDDPTPQLVQGAGGEQALVIDFDAMEEEGEEEEERTGEGGGAGSAVLRRPIGSKYRCLDANW